MFPQKACPAANHDPHDASGNTEQNHQASSREQVGRRLHQEGKNGPHRGVNPKDRRHAHRHAGQRDAITEQDAAYPPAESVGRAGPHRLRPCRVHGLPPLRRHERGHEKRQNDHHDQRRRDIDIFQLEVPALLERDGKRSARDGRDENQYQSQNG